MKNHRSKTQKFIVGYQWFDIFPRVNEDISYCRGGKEIQIHFTGKLCYGRDFHLGTEIGRIIF